MKEKCKEQVWDNFLFKSVPCSRNVWAEKPIDGCCKQHHPDTVKARREKSNARWKSEMQNSPLAKAMRRIAELEAEIARLKTERGGE